MDITTANRLYELRKKHGYSQDELAGLLNVSRQAVSKWERSESSPDTDNLIALAKLYNVSIDDLLDYTPENRTANSTDNDATNKDKSNQSSEQDNDDNVNCTIDDDDIKINVDGKDKIYIGKKGIHINNQVHIDKKGIRINDGNSDEDPIIVSGRIMRKASKKSLIRSITDGIITLLCVVAYLLMGFLAELWHPGWIIFFLIPIVPCIVSMFVDKNLNSFPMPLIATAIFLILGTVLNAWHPGWIVLLSVPIYYCIAGPIQHYIIAKRIENGLDTSIFDDDDFDDVFED